MWSDNAWKRHLELAAQVSSYSQEVNWCLHYFPDCRVVFLNEKTAQEFEQVFTAAELSTINYGPELLCCLPFIKWPEGMKPAHYGRRCKV